MEIFLIPVLAFKTPSKVLHNAKFNFESQTCWEKYIGAHEKWFPIIHFEVQAKISWRLTGITVVASVLEEVHGHYISEEECEKSCYEERVKPYFRTPRSDGLLCRSLYAHVACVWTLPTHECRAWKCRRKRLRIKPIIEMTYKKQTQGTWYGLFGTVSWQAYFF